MGTFTLYYSAVEDSIKQARKTASVLDLYSKDMSAVASSCSTITDSGYGQTAQAMARKKAQDAIVQKEKFEKLAQDLSDLESFAKSQDQSLANSIDVAVSNYVGKRKWYQTALDWVRGTYEGFLDRVSGLPIVGKSIAHAIRVAEDWVTNSTIKIHNYFKYGDGKYIWNSIKAVAGVFVAVMGVVAAAAAVLAAATPLLVTIAIVGLVAGGVAFVLKFGDMMATVESNTRAFTLAQEYRQSTKGKDNSDWYRTENDKGSLSYARYYGDISSVNDLIKHIDFGGKASNNAMGVIGGVYSFTENAAELTSSICTVTVALGNAQYLKSADGKWIMRNHGKSDQVRTKAGSFLENVRTSYAEKAGATFQRTPKTNQYARHAGKRIITSQDYSKAFHFKMFEGYGKKFEKYGLKVSRSTQAVYNVSKHIQTFDKTASGIEKIVDYVSGDSFGFEAAYKAGKSSQGLLKNFEFVDAYTDDGMKGIGVVHDIVKDIVDHLNPKENAYAAYLKAHP